MKGYRSIRRIAVAAIGFLLAAFIMFGCAADEASMPYWDSYNVDIEVQTNGDLWVTETQIYVFDSAYSNQRKRKILWEGGFEDIQDITVHEIVQGNLVALPFEQQIITQEGQPVYLEISWQHELNPPDRHTFVVRYRVIGGLFVGTRETRLDWQAVPSNRRPTVRSATATVHLPSVLMRKALSFKSYGTPTINRAVGDRTFEFRTTKPISSLNPLGVQVAFPSEILNLPRPKGLFFPFFIPLPYVNLLPIRLFIDRYGFIIFILIIVLSAISCQYCPQCKKLELETKREVLVEPVGNTPGKLRVIEHCQSCGYHKEREEKFTES